MRKLSEALPLRSVSKELRAAVRAAEAAGWTVRLLRSGNLRFAPPPPCVHCLESQDNGRCRACAAPLPQAVVTASQVSKVRTLQNTLGGEGHRRSRCTMPARCSRCRQPATEGKWCDLHQKAPRASQEQQNKPQRRAPRERSTEPQRRAAREFIVREQGSFLHEDLAQEQALAELEGRAFDRRAFHRQHAPYQERTRFPEWKL